MKSSKLDPQQSVSEMSKEELIKILSETCDENSNDQILGYKLRIFSKCLKEGVVINPEHIKFVN